MQVTTLSGAGQWSFNRGYGNAALGGVYNPANHRIAIGNRRLVAMDGETVTFRWKDYARGGRRRTMTLAAMTCISTRIAVCPFEAPGTVGM